MKKFFYYVSLLSFIGLFTACPNKPLDKNGQHTADNAKIQPSVEPIKGTGQAHPILKGTNWHENHKVNCRFSGDSNLCTFEIADDIMTAIYTVNEADNKIVFDFKPYIEYCSKFNVAAALVEAHEGLLFELKQIQAELNTPGITDGEKASLNKMLKIINSFKDKAFTVDSFKDFSVQMAKAVIDDLKNVLNTPGLPEKEKKELAEAVRKLEAVIADPSIIDKELELIVENKKLLGVMLKQSDSVKGSFTPSIKNISSIILDKMFAGTENNKPVYRKMTLVKAGLMPEPFSGK